MTLAMAPVTADGASPTRWIVFLHGILGSGANWRSFARRLVAARPEWGALLVDLRLHGESQGIPGPHTLEAAARDVVESTRDYAVGAVLGHSFGGKVGIEVAGMLGTLSTLYVIDSTPGLRPDYRGSSGVREIVELLLSLPEEFPDRNAFQAWAEKHGVSRPTAMWLAMNIRPIAGTTRFAFRIDVKAVRAMMEDYFVRDLWPVIENAPATLRTHLIAGGKSEVLDAADIERGRRAPHATVDVIPNAGHWLHVDAPDTLFDLVTGYLPGA